MDQIYICYRNIYTYLQVFYIHVHFNDNHSHNLKCCFFFLHFIYGRAKKQRHIPFEILQFLQLVHLILSAKTYPCFHTRIIRDIFHIFQLRDTLKTVAHLVVLFCFLPISPHALPACNIFHLLNFLRPRAGELLCIFMWNTGWYVAFVKKREIVSPSS